MRESLPPLPDSVEKAIAVLRVEAVKSTYPYGAGGHDEQGASDRLRLAIRRALMEEREACALECEYVGRHLIVVNLDEAVAETATNCAQEVRARPTEPTHE